MTPLVGPHDLSYSYRGQQKVCTMTAYRKPDVGVLCVLAMPHQSYSPYEEFGIAAMVASVILEHNHNVSTRNVIFALRRGQRVEIARFGKDAWGSIEFVAKAWETGSPNPADPINWNRI